MKIEENENTYNLSFLMCNINKDGIQTHFLIGTRNEGLIGS